MTMADAPALSRITTLAELDEVLATSSDRPMWIFKHSLSCGISSDAWRRFEAFADRRLDQSSVAVVEIQDAREVSSAVSDRTGIRHESPQVLLIKSGRPVWHASHWKITDASLGAAAAALELPAEAASATS